MAFFYLLPVILPVIFVASFIAAIIRTIQTEFTNCSIPPGVSNPGKLRLVLIVASTLYEQGDASNLEDVLEGAHIPPDMRLEYRKWMNPDNIPEEFKVRGYKPSKPCEFKAGVVEKVKRICEHTLCPLRAEDTIIQQLPESFILTCEYDVLRDDGLLYKKRLEDNGVRVTWYHLEDGFHGIINLFDYSYLSFPSGKRGLDRVISFIKGL